MERPRDQADDDGDLAARLPDDVIAEVLRRLAPRWLAASRCVCKAWRAVVDTRGLLRTDLLPLSLAGIFIFSEFFSRPATAISGKVDFLPLPANMISKGIGYYHNEFVVRDHCNGLVLVNNFVVKPRHAALGSSSRSPSDNYYFFNEYLVFDPTVSNHYEIGSLGGEVFCSTRKCCRTVAELHDSLSSLFSAYWRGSLYVHCQKFVMRISLSEDKYSVIQLPVTTTGDRSYHSPYLGRSEKGVYLAAFGKGGLHVWILNESCGETECILKGEYSLKPVRAFNRQVYGPWILQDNNSDFYRDQLPGANKEEAIIAKEKFEWNSDDDDFPDKGDHVVEARRCEILEIEILGFHPYKEIMFVSVSKSYKTMEMATGLAYHLNSSRVQALGSTYPTHYEHFDVGAGLVNEDRSIGYSFPYTPCWIGEPPREQ